MADLPLLPSDELRVNKRWLWVVRILLLIPIIFAVAYAIWSFVPGLKGPCPEDTRAGAVNSLVLAAPFALSAWHLWRISLKKGLAWAVVTGGFWFGICVLVTVGDVLSGVSTGTIIWGSLALSQGALAAAAIKTYYSMAREKSDRRILLNRVLLFVPYLVVLVLAAAQMPSVLQRLIWIRPGVASQVGCLRTINTVEETYRATYKKGYSPTLKALGPPPNGAPVSATAASLIDPVLASGQRAAYTFTYTPGPLNSVGEITTYTLTAVPSDAGCTDWNRYFTDETGLIRATQENRPATAQDPPI
jgi:hypothetical protein